MRYTGYRRKKVNANPYYPIFVFMIEATGIEKSFGSLKVLNGVSLSLKQGEIVSIVGSSGAGKTTLLQILGTLDYPSNPKECTLRINNQNILSLTSKELARFRNTHIGFVFQFHQLLPEFTALENVCLPAFIKKESKLVAEKKAKELLDFLGVSNRLHHKPNELSGGEQQRVAVARALINSPSVIFADEPSGNLDSKSAQQLHQLILDLRKELNQTFVIVTHNKDLAHLADRMLTMADGKILSNK